MKTKQASSREDILFDIFREERRHFYNEECIRLLSVVSGTVKITYQKEESEFTAGGLLVINPFEWCFFDGCRGAAIVLTIPLKYLKREGTESCGRISLKVSGDFPGEKREFHEIRRALANLWKLCFGLDQAAGSTFSKNVFRLFSLLRDHFSDPAGFNIFKIDPESTKYRMSRAVGYIHAHWQENLTVGEIADFVYVSPNYLSRLWRESMACTLFDYIYDIRLDYAEKQLHSRRSITEIAAFCGFKNTNALNKRFFSAFGLMPKEYRELAGKDAARFPVSLQSEGLDLTLFLSYGDEAEREEGKTAERRELVIEADAPGRKLSHKWRRLVNIGYARDGLVELVQGQLLRAQREIGFEYVRFHGIFDEDMHIFYESPEGELKPNYILTDLLLDFLLSTGLKPFIEFSYTPKALAGHPVRVLERETYFSRVNDPEKWGKLIRLFLGHVIERYGEAAVLSWRFSVSGAELKLQGYLTEEEYLAHYLVSFRAVKSVNPALKFGGFGGHSSLIMEVDEFREFVEFCMENDGVPDFFCIQNFPVEYVKKGTSANPVLLQKISPVTISADVHYSMHLIRKTKQILEEYGFFEKEIWFEEWNSSIWQRDVANDTCYKAAWMIKDICENYDRAEAFGYWLLTDFIEERLPHDNLAYFGGSSLITYNGIPKAGWNAMRLLRKLGEACIASGDGYFVTRSENKIQILLYHYVHYGDMYRFCNQMPIGAERAYDIFVSRSDREFHIKVKHKGFASCRIKKYIVSREQGSSFDCWIGMGKPGNMDREEIEYLKGLSAHGLMVEEWTEPSDVVIDTVLTAHLCELYELSYQL